MTEKIPEHFNDWQAYIASDLQRFLVYHTGLPDDHPYVRLSINAALKHVGYCAADLSFEDKESILFTKEQAFLQTYAEHVARFYTHFMEAKGEVGNPGLTEADLHQMKSILENFSSASFKKATNITNAVKAGEIEAWEPPKPEPTPPYLNKHYLSPKWNSTSDQLYKSKSNFMDKLMDAEHGEPEPETEDLEPNYLNISLDKPNHDIDVTDAKIDHLIYCHKLGK